MNSENKAINHSRLARAGQALIVAGVISFGVGGGDLIARNIRVIAKVEEMYPGIPMERMGIRNINPYTPERYPNVDPNDVRAKSEEFRRLYEQEENTNLIVNGTPVPRRVLDGGIFFGGVLLAHIGGRLAFGRKR